MIIYFLQGHDGQTELYTLEMTQTNHLEVLINFHHGVGIEQ